MPKKITKVRWTATNVPYGVSFNETTGTFSGTPDEVGEYTVPVKVETNYGEDTKNVKLNVGRLSFIVPLYDYRGVGKTCNLRNYLNGICLQDDGITAVEYWFKSEAGVLLPSVMNPNERLSSSQQSYLYCGTGGNKYPEDYIYRWNFDYDINDGNLKLTNNISTGNKYLSPYMNILILNIKTNKDVEAQKITFTLHVNMLDSEIESTEFVKVI